MGLKFNPFTGNFDFTNDANGALGNVQYSNGAGSFTSTSNIQILAPGNLIFSSGAKIGMGIMSAPSYHLDISTTGQNHIRLTSTYGEHLIYADETDFFSDSLIFRTSDATFYTGTFKFFGNQIEIGDYAQLYISPYGVQLYGTQIFDWSYGVLIYNATGFVTIDAQNHIMYDNSNVQSYDWSTRVFADGTGALSLDYQARILTDNVSGTCISWQDRYLIDTTANVSVDWETRQLKSTGPTQSINWESRICYDSGGNLSINYTSRTLTSSAITRLDWSGTYVKLKDRVSVTSALFSPVSAIHVDQSYDCTFDLSYIIWF